MGCGTSTANGQDSVASLGDENKRPLSGTSQKEASEKEKALNGDTNDVTRIEGGGDVDEKSKLKGEEISDPDKTHSSLDSNCNNKKCDSLLENGVKKDNQGGNKRKDNEKEESQNKQAPRSIAFSIDLDSNASKNLMPGKLPPRLQRLAPLQNAPKLTAQSLSEKIQMAEKKREEQLSQKIQKSKRQTKRKKDLIEAQKFAESQKQYSQIEIQQRSAGKNREAHMLGVVEKQRRREERAKKALERAKKQLELEKEEVSFDVEQDDSFNNDDTDSWLDGDNNSSTLDDDDRSMGERIYSGRESPCKKYDPNAQRKMYSHSASTVDSFDNAFMKEPPVASTREGTRDDFFD